jgi:flagellar assembly factor FliW
MKADVLPVTRTTHLEFTAPPPGLAPLVEFDLADVEGALGLYTMRAAAVAEIRLFLVDPAYFVPDYAPELRPDDLAGLGAASADEVDVYVVATLAEGAPVVNLMAPIVVNPLTSSASQVILDGDDWPLQAPLTPLGA